MQVKANEALYEDKAKMWLKREKDDQGGDTNNNNNNKKSVDYEDDNQVPSDADAKSGSQGNKDNDSR